MTYLKPLFCMFLMAHAVYGAERVLKMPSKSSSVETVEREILDMHPHEGVLMVLTGETHTPVRLQFNPAGKTREAMFGTLSDAKRLIPPEEDMRSYSLVQSVPGGVLLFDDTDLSLTKIDEEGTRIGYRSLVWDRLRPPRDRGGEAPSFEVDALRAKFKKELSKRSQDRFIGMAEDSSKVFGASKGTRYLMGTNLPSFPVVSMECSGELATQCSLSRACFVDQKGYQGELSKGLALLPKKAGRSSSNILAIGKPDGHRIDFYRVKSCFHISRVNSVILPPRLKRLSNLELDPEGGLWVSTEAPDDYNNASVYYWKYDEWQQFLPN